MSLDSSRLREWHPTLARNLTRLKQAVHGQPHQRHLDRWKALIEAGDVVGLQGVLTGLDRDSIEMREVSPMSGLLPPDERREALEED